MIPYTDYECRLKLEELYRGDSIIVPSSMDHAKFMLGIAQNYIDDSHNETLKLLKVDYE